MKIHNIFQKVIVLVISLTVISTFIKPVQDVHAQSDYELLVPGFYSDQNSALIYEGEWEILEGEHYVDGMITQTDFAGSNLYFQFEGGGLMVDYLQSPRNGALLVELDGEIVDVILQFGEEETSKRWTSLPIEPGLHEIRLINQFGMVNIDAVEIVWELENPVFEFPVLMEGEYEINHESAMLRGQWEPIFDDYFSNGYCLETNLPGSRLTFNVETMSESEIEINYNSGPNGGIVRVDVNGETVDYIDTFTPDFENQSWKMDSGGGYYQIAFINMNAWRFNIDLLRVKNVQFALADTDKDGLPDIWEINGYDADGDGVIDVDLPALGADPDHKDIFVEMDYMVKNGVDLGPGSQLMNDIIAVFANAPVSNPDGKTGITIHLEKDDQLTYQAMVSLPYVNGLLDWTNFDTIKNANFDQARLATHHYMIWINQWHSSESSGVSRGIGGSDFIVAVGSWNSQGGTYEQRIGTFIHELGHNLGLTHGGNTNDHTNYKPNYLSIMNYRFQFWGVYRDGHYGTDGASYRDRYDYQRFALDSLDENNLNEAAGLNPPTAANNYGTVYNCPGGKEVLSSSISSVDWNCDLDTLDTNLSINLNPDVNVAKTVLGATWNDWENIIYSGGGVIGSGLPLNEISELVPGQTSFMEEVTLDLYLQLEAQHEILMELIR